jgi:hypothetical protein
MNLQQRITVIILCGIDDPGYWNFVDGVLQINLQLRNQSNNQHTDQQ